MSAIFILIFVKKIRLKLRVIKIIMFTYYISISLDIFLAVQIGKL